MTDEKLNIKIPIFQTSTGAKSTNINNEQNSIKINNVEFPTGNYEFVDLSIRRSRDTEVKRKQLCDLKTNFDYEKSLEERHNYVWKLNKFKQEEISEKIYLTNYIRYDYEEKVKKEQINVYECVKLTPPQSNSDPQTIIKDNNVGNGIIGLTQQEIFHNQYLKEIRDAAKSSHQEFIAKYVEHLKCTSPKNPFSNLDESKREYQRKRLASESSEAREQRLKLSREYQKQRIASESKETREKRLCQIREYRRQRIASETKEERERRLRQIREYQRQRIASETKEQREQRLIQIREYQKHRIANETSEQREQRLSQVRSNQKQRLANESKEQREQRLNQIKEYQRQRLAAENKEQRELRLLQIREQQKTRLANETFEQRQQRLMKIREYQEQRIANETVEQRRCRLNQLRDYQNQRLAAKAKEISELK